MWHWLVPMGGTRGRLMGATLGGVSGQTRGPQTGRRSIAEEQIASTWPLTQVHSQRAAARPGMAIEATARPQRTARFIPTPLYISSALSTSKRYARLGMRRGNDRAAVHGSELTKAVESIHQSE